MRAFGVLASAVFAAFSAFVVLMFWYARVEHEEPLSSTQHATEGRMLAVAVLLLFVALVALAGVGLQNVGLATGAFALHLLLAAVLLRYALHGSQHSDGKLVVFAAIVELTGLAGLLDVARERSFAY
jgi:hypothetical protein